YEPDHYSFPNILRPRPLVSLFPYTTLSRSFTPGSRETAAMSTSIPLRGSIVPTASTKGRGNRQGGAADPVPPTVAGQDVTPCPMASARAAAGTQSASSQATLPVGTTSVSATRAARPIIERCQRLPRRVSVSGWVHGTVS